ncbi:hypothetical protein [Desulfogranum mediterraneum]|uniref:hypothetical protein n=1 Tax=Desulfogranum mediterraneum TaxID=160661 RepID=UPI001ABF8707|nr:hypothetical protein [Desulfogranum mediterraneum]
MRKHNQIHRQVHRGELEYLLHNKSSGRIYRFSPLVYGVIGLMDGRRTVQEIWELSVQRHGDQAPGQDEILQLLSQLFAADVLLVDVEPDLEALLRIREQRSAPSRGRPRGNPLFFRIPLLDPDRFLSASFPLFKVLFSWPFLLLALLCFAGAALQLRLHWAAFTSSGLERVLTLENMAIIFLLYPLVKGMHELSHGYAVKKWGGEVHEMGLMVLVFMPLPYVDASSASLFPGKWQRFAVGAAGIYMELLLATLAVFSWLAWEPGLARTVAFNLIVISGLSTLLFNANPLVKFDGYYMLSDLLELPNLGPRSRQQLALLVRRYLFGLSPEGEVVTTRREQGWLLAYGLSSILYRTGISLAILWYLSSRYLGLGLGLALFGIWVMLAAPLVKAAGSLEATAVRQGKRGVFLARTGLLLVGGLLVLLVPLPHLSVLEGVLRLPEESYLRPGGDGVVSEIVAREGSQVRPGELLIRCSDPGLVNRLTVLQSQLREYRQRYQLALAVDQTEARIIEEQLQPLEQRIGRLREQQEALTISSQVKGRFILANGADLVGRFVPKGALLGYVLNRATIVRVAVEQPSIELVRSSRPQVELRSVAAPAMVLQGTILRELPGATNTLPSPVLGSAGGGRIPVESDDSGNFTTFERVFLIDLALAKPLDAILVDQRILVRFDHGRASLAWRFYRFCRQLFLRRLDG